MLNLPLQRMRIFALTPLLLAFSPQDPSFNPPSLDLTLSNGETEQYVIEVCIPGETNVSMADVFLLADSTGSMGDEIAQVQADAALILNTLLGDANIDFQIGVGDYKDSTIRRATRTHRPGIQDTLYTVQLAIKKLDKEMKLSNPKI